MKTFALIALVLLLSACVKPPAGQPQVGAQEQLEDLGVQEEANTGLETMPEYDAGEEDTSLLGEDLGLGSLI